MTFEVVKLRNICKTTSGGTPSRNVSDYYNGDIPWVKSGELKDGPIFQTEEKISKSAIENSSAKIFPAGTLLIALYGATVGKLGSLGIDAATNQAVCAIFTSDRIDRDFLFYYLLNQRDHLIDRRFGGAQPNISQDILRDVEIPLPPLDEQKHIAAILSKADRLRRLRRYARELSDGYLQSVFLEMFGDPVSNPRGWETATLGDVLVSVKDGPHVSPKYADSGIPFLSTRNVRRGEIIWEDLKYISREDAEELWRNPACKPEKGNILYTKGGTTGLAKAVDFDVEVAVWVHIAVLKLRRDRVVPIWLENMLNTDYCYHQSQELTFGIVNRDLGLKRMPRIKIYLPPLPLQQKFAHIVQKYERLRAQQREAERQAEHLFQSLLHRAFRREI